MLIENELLPGINELVGCLTPLAKGLCERLVARLG